MPKIYTRTGDNGDTDFIGGRVSKADLLMELIGTLDELNAQLGLVVLELRHEQHVVTRVQNELFQLGAYLAEPQQPQGTTLVIAKLISNLEAEIDSWEAKLPVLQNFILPGGSVAGARLHVARTVCRRAERACVRYSPQMIEVTYVLEIQRYLNRLSDWLFTVARVVNLAAHQPEQVWQQAS